MRIFGVFGEVESFHLTTRQFSHESTKGYLSLLHAAKRRGGAEGGIFNYHIQKNG